MTTHRYTIRPLIDDDKAGSVRGRVISSFARKSIDLLASSALDKYAQPGAMHGPVYVKAQRLETQLDPEVAA